jgi:hypothetical protein
MWQICQTKRGWRRRLIVSVPGIYAGSLQRQLSRTFEALRTDQAYGRPPRNAMYLLCEAPTLCVTSKFLRGNPNSMTLQCSSLDYSRLPFVFKTHIMMFQ